MEVKPCLLGRSRGGGRFVEEVFVDDLDVEALLYVLLPFAEALLLDFDEDIVADLSVVRFSGHLFQTEEVETGGHAQRIADLVGLERKDRRFDILRHIIGAADGRAEISVLGGGLGIVGILFRQFHKIGAAANLRQQLLYLGFGLGFVEDFFGFWIGLRRRIGAKRNKQHFDFGLRVAIAMLLVKFLLLLAGNRRR